jgi:hypothetical protein
MSIFVLDGVLGEIRTSTLPSGDVAVSCPDSGPLRQIANSVCQWDGYEAPTYGGWIVRKGKSWKLHKSLEERCRKIAG